MQVVAKRLLNGRTRVVQVDVEKLEQEAASALEQAGSLEQIEELRGRFLGRSSGLTVGPRGGRGAGGGARPRGEGHPTPPGAWLGRGRKRRAGGASTTPSCSTS